MGTRGVVGWKTETGWRGVYNHWDSYPTGLGKHVYIEIMKIVESVSDLMFFDNRPNTVIKAPIPFNIKQQKVQYAMNQIIEYLKECDDWRQYESEGICEYCGKKTGQPHSISGLICFSEADTDMEQKLKKAIPELKLKDPLDEIKDNLKRTGYPDPDAKHHQHSNGKEDQITNETADPLNIEYIWILIPETMSVELWVNHGFCLKRNRVYNNIIVKNDQDLIFIANTKAKKMGLDSYDALQKIKQEIKLVTDVVYNNKIQAIYDRVTKEAGYEALEWENYEFCQYRHFKLMTFNILSVDPKTFFESIDSIESELQEKISNELSSVKFEN